MTYAGSNGTVRIYMWYVHLHAHTFATTWIFVLCLKVSINVPKANDSGVKLSYADSSCFKDSNESVLVIDWTGNKGTNCSLQLKFLHNVSFTGCTWAYTHYRFPITSMPCQFQLMYGMCHNKVSIELFTDSAKLVPEGANHSLCSRNGRGVLLLELSTCTQLLSIF